MLIDYQGFDPKLPQGHGGGNADRTCPNNDDIFVQIYFPLPRLFLQMGEIFGLGSQCSGLRHKEVSVLRSQARIGLGYQCSYFSIL